MKKIKKYIAVMLCFCLSISFAACSQKSSNSDSEKLSIVCTIFPEYDWVREITKNNDNVDLKYLLDNGVDLHNYQPTADDIITISNCDMFIYVGGESDGWVEDALKSAKNENMVVINLLDVLGSSAKEEEVIEGMQAEDNEESAEEEPEYDEHVWLSLKNAEVLCQYIFEQLCKIDSDNSEIYEANTDNYVKQLSDLDSQYQATVDNAKIKTVLFGDRFPFRYLTDDYGIEYFAAFAGCSAETEASFETISFLANKTDELGLNTVLTIEGTDSKIAETIISNTENKNMQILSMNSMQGVVNDGDTYVSIMQDNLNVLADALA
ncbi:MAG: metal ABC transporter substrate-binding protein [Eubacterium sp.]